VISFVA